MTEAGVSAKIDVAIWRGGDAMDKKKWKLCLFACDRVLSELFP